MNLRMAAPTVASALAASLAVGACSLGDKQERADAVVDAVEAVDALGTAHGSVEITGIEILRAPDAAGFDAGDVDLTERGLDGSDGPLATFDVAIDTEARRSVVFVDGAPHQLFVDGAVYGRRNDAIPEDARPWLRLRLDDIDDDESHLDVRDETPLALLAAIDPLLLLDLAAGPLAGSASDPVPADLDGEAMTRFAANMDIEKTLEDTRRRYHDEDDRETTNLVLDLLDIRGNIHAGDAWVDEQGRLRRFEWHVEIEPFRDLVLAVTVALDLDSFGDAVTVDVPDDIELLEVDALITFVRSVLPNRIGPDPDPNASADTDSGPADDPTGVGT